MSEEDEVQRLVFELLGESKLRDFTKELEKEKEAIRQAGNDLRNHEIDLEQFSERAGASAMRILDLNKEVKALGSSAGVNRQALLQFQYILDDLLNTSGGVERKLAAISNNIPGFVQSLGASGVAGAVGVVTTVLIALTPIAVKAWEALSGESGGFAEKARERLKELREEIAKTHKEFEKLTNAPTDAEKTAAEGVKLFLQARPNADRARAAVAGGMTRAEAVGALPGETQLALAHAESEANVSDDELQRQANRAAREQWAQGGGEGAPPQELIDDELKKRKEFRARAREQADQVVQKARTNRAEAIVSGAAVAGPAGAKDRQRLMELTKNRPEFRELQNYTPERIAADEAEYQAQLEKDAEEKERLEASKAARRQARADVDDEIQRNAEADQANLQDWQHGKANAKQKAAQQARKAAELARENERAGREIERQEQRRPVEAMTREMAPYGHAAGLPDEAIVHAAQEAVAMTRQGLDAQSAAQTALAQAIQQMVALRQRAAMLQQQQQQLMQQNMGADLTGMFSPFPPMWP
jgi:hypothetical protein